MNGVKFGLKVDDFIIAVLVAVYTCLMLYPLAIKNGVPAYEQDWQWPIHSAQCAPYALLGAEPWNSTGIGTAQSYPESWLPYAVGGSLCAAVGPHNGLTAYLALIALLAGSSITWLVRQYTRVIAASVVALALYLGNAVVLNKLHAGHLHFLFSYAVLPAFIASLIDARTYRNWLVVGPLLGIASAQPQFFFFALALGPLVAAARYNTAWFLHTGLAALVIALLFTSPQWALSGDRAASFGAFSPLLHWEQSQSVPFSEAVRFLGYIGGYDKALPAWLQIFSWVLPIVALGGTFAAFADRKGRLWPFVAFFCLLLVNGLYGPLKFLIVALLQRSDAFAIFRELFTFEALVALSFAILAAIAVSFLSRRHGAPVLLVTIVMVALAGSTSAFAAKNIPAFDPPPTGSNFLEKIAALPGMNRYLAIPSGLQQRLDNAGVSGSSPFTIPIGAHASAINPLYEPPYSLIAASRHAPTDAALNELAVAAVLAVPDAKQVSNYEPQLRSFFTRLPPAAQNRWHLTKRSADRLAFLSGRNIQVADISSGFQFDLQRHVVDVNPRQGWVHTALWNNLPIWIYSRPAGIFTLRSSAVLALRGRSVVVAGAASANVSSQNCSTLQRLDKHYVILRCNGTLHLRGEPPLAVSEAFAGTTNPFQIVSNVTAGQVSIEKESRWNIDATVNSKAGSVLFLSERYDPGWRCSECGSAEHVRVASFANAWVLRSPLSRRIRVVFEPSYYYFAALCLSIAVLVAAVIDAALVFARQRKAYHQRAVLAE